MNLNPQISGGYVTIPGTIRDKNLDRLRVGYLSGRGAARAEDAQGTPSQSHISPSTLVYEDKSRPFWVATWTQ